MDSIFKKTLRAELDYQDIKVKELAARTGISARTLEGYLNARGSIPPADVAVKIAQTLNVSVEYLVTGDPSHNIKNQTSISHRSVEEKISQFPIEKRKLVRDFLTLIDEYEIVSK